MRGALVLVAMIACGAPQAPAPSAAALPSVADVMEHYVRALGGRDAILAHASMTMHVRFDVPGKGATDDRIFLARGLRRYDEAARPDGSVDRTGYDGRVAWEIDGAKPPEIAHGDLVQSIARDADMYYPTHIVDYFATMSVVGTEDFAGHHCWHLVGTTRWGNTNEHFYDTTSGLLIGYRFDSSWRGGPGVERELFEDYRAAGGWLVPRRIEHVQPARTIVETVLSVTFDDVGDATFALPDPIKALAAHG